MKKSEYTRGKLAEKTGCNPETIRYYEKEGLLQKAIRSHNGYRIYTETDAKRLRFILRCRELGFSVLEIRSLLDLVDKKDYTCSDIRTITQTHIADVKEKISDLKKIFKTLQEMSEKCRSNKGKDCPILDALEKHG